MNRWELVGYTLAVWFVGMAFGATLWGGADAEEQRFAKKCKKLVPVAEQLRTDLEAARFYLRLCEVARSAEQNISEGYRRLCTH